MTDANRDASARCLDEKSLEQDPSGSQADQMDVFLEIAKVLHPLRLTA